MCTEAAEAASGFRRMTLEEARELGLRVNTGPPVHSEPPPELLRDALPLRCVPELQRPLLTVALVPRLVTELHRHSSLVGV